LRFKLILGRRTPTGASDAMLAIDPVAIAFERATKAVIAEEEREERTSA
jgi:hypothetical protein